MLFFEHFQCFGSFCTPPPGKPGKKFDPLEKSMSGWDKIFNSSNKVQHITLVSWGLGWCNKAKYNPLLSTVYWIKDVVLWMGFTLRNCLKLALIFKLQTILCLSGQEMAPTGQRTLLKDSWSQNLIMWEEEHADPPIAYITSVNVM